MISLAVKCGKDFLCGRFLLRADLVGNYARYPGILKRGHRHLIILFWAGR